MPLKQAEIEAFLRSLNATQLAIDDAEAKGFRKMDELARELGSPDGLSNEAKIKRVHAEEEERKREAAREALEKRLAPLKPAEIERFRLTFDWFDADASGELDKKEFKKAMVDCGMMPLGFEVEALFAEADEDGSGHVSFDEYLRFVQIYRSKQNFFERLMESFMDLITSKPAYLSNPTLRFIRKMQLAGCNKSAIDAFVYNYSQLRGNASMMIPEADIYPVDHLPALEDLLVTPDPSLLQKTVMVKLNGGLGTGMGLEKAKSLLPIAGDDTFLDLIAKQVVAMRQQWGGQLGGGQLAFLLMNSFATSDDTMAHLKKYRAGISTEGLPLEFVQNKAPKVAAADSSPAVWPDAREHEWYPPGHGDLYAAIYGSGTLQKLLAQGYKYMFVSNSDNLGATLDLKLLTWFAQSGAPFAMEVAARTDSDKKGGHLARHEKTGGLLLRESAQCPEEDEPRFADVTRHRFFNTNNLWLDLERLKAKMDEHKGVMPLPVMMNKKTVDPRDPHSTPVLQLETAMGAAIECFGQEAEAILIPRSRFAPVKTTADLLAIMSDAYEVKSDHRVVLAAERHGVPPLIKLDGLYKFVDALSTLVPESAPSLLRCNKLTIEGKFVLANGVVFEGDVKLVNKGDEPRLIQAGVYKDSTL